MKSLNRRPRFAMLLSALVAGGTVVAIAASDSPRALWDTLKRIEPQWLAVAFGFELLSYVGYVLAYRSMVLDGSEERLSLMLVIRLVVAGFGPFVPLGGFSFDRRALGSVHRSRREARRQVLALGVIEYLLLAPAACVCALILLLESGRASLVLTLPWVFAVPPGFALTWWATQPRIVRRFERGEGSVAPLARRAAARGERAARNRQAPARAPGRGASAWRSTGPPRSPAWRSRCAASASS